MNEASQTEQRISLTGAPGSPYTRKMLAVLRYRHIPHRFVVSNELKTGLPVAKPALLPTFYLQDECGQLQAVTDSTPLIRKFEGQYDGRKVRPSDPVLAMLDSLIEDYADEWLTKPMYHYRWAFESDIDRASRIIPLPMNIQCTPEAHETITQIFGARQVSRRSVVGSSDATASLIQASYLRLIAILEKHFTKHAFLMGARPGASDFAVYGQLTQLALFDPTPMELTCKAAPRVVAWTQYLEDLSGLEPKESDWQSLDEIPETLKALLSEIGRTYVPVMLANEKAVANIEPFVEAEIDKHKWTQQAFTYQRKCLGWLRQEAEALSAEHQQAWKAMLAGTGCERLFERA